MFVCSVHNFDWESTRYERKCKTNVLQFDPETEISSFVVPLGIELGLNEQMLQRALSKTVLTNINISNDTKVQ